MPTCSRSGVSTASTVPADDNLALSLVSADLQSLKTPSPRDKVSVAEVVSAPKTTQKQHMRAGRSPTVHYSPSKGEGSRSKRGKVAVVPEAPEKATAVKKAAKPPQKSIDKKKQLQVQDQKVKNQPPKQETATVPTPAAVAATLQRAATVDIHNGPTMM